MRAVLNRMNSRISSLWSKLRSKAYRDAFSQTQLATGVAAQIQTMREDRGLTQAELADACGMTQSRISLIEDPSYDRMSISTLKRVASAFDVALVVRFVPFSELLRSAAAPSENKFSVVPFDQDSPPALPSPNWSLFADVHTEPAGILVTQSTGSKDGIKAVIAPRAAPAGASHAAA